LTEEALMSKTKTPDEAGREVARYADSPEGRCEGRKALIEEQKQCPITKRGRPQGSECLFL